MEARATERSGGNVSYAQHVIFGDPSKHFFAGGTFAHPLHICACVRVYVCGLSERDKKILCAKHTHIQHQVQGSRKSRGCIGNLAKTCSCLHIYRRTSLVSMYVLCMYWLHARFARCFSIDVCVPLCASRRMCTDSM